MKKILSYCLLALIAFSVSSCDKDEVFYDFSENPGIGATFSSGALQVPGITAEMNGKVSIPLYRGNVSEAASVAVELQGGGSVYTLSKGQFDFAAGENVAYVDVVFNFDNVTPSPVKLTMNIVNEADAAENGYASTSFSMQLALTYNSLGYGIYYSDFAGEWYQEVLKAEEDAYYQLPSCWVNGTNFLFYCNGERFEWLTTGSGYIHPSYGGEILFELEDYMLTENSFTLSVELYMAGIGTFGGGFIEHLTLPDGYTW